MLNITSLNVQIFKSLREIDTLMCLGRINGFDITDSLVSSIVLTDESIGESINKVIHSLLCSNLKVNIFSTSNLFNIKLDPSIYYDLGDIHLVDWSKEKIENYFISYESISSYYRHVYNINDIGRYFSMNMIDDILPKNKYLEESNNIYICQNIEIILDCINKSIRNNFARYKYLASYNDFLRFCLDYLNTAKYDLQEINNNLMLISGLGKNG